MACSPHGAMWSGPLVAVQEGMSDVCVLVLSTSMAELAHGDRPAAGSHQCLGFLVSHGHGLEGLSSATLLSVCVSVRAATQLRASARVLVLSVGCVFVSASVRTSSGC